MTSVCPVFASFRRMTRRLLAITFFCLMVMQHCPEFVLAQDETAFSNDQIREAARGVMQHDDFRRLRGHDNDNKGFLSKLLEKLDDDSTNKQSDNQEGGSVGGIANSVAGGIGQLLMVVALLAVAVLIGFAIVMIIRSIENRDRKAKMAGPLSPIELDSIISNPPGELATEQYQQRADDYARTGDYRAAVRQLLLGCMSWVERAELIHYRRGLTNRDYWRAVYREESRRLAFASIAFEFEKVFFGRRHATAEMYQACLNQFLKEFHEHRVIATI